jgi:PKD repeat protein
MRKILPFLLGLFFCASISIAQDTQSKEDLVQVRKTIASDLSDRYEHLLLSKNALLLKAAARNIPVRIPLAYGDYAELLYFDVLDQPVYYKVMNANAAKTTGTAALQPGGELGVNLTGKGMVVGIYDQTRPKSDHVEYKGRLTQVDGSTETISSHATHVTGTVLATGITSNAKGMASEATGWAFNWESDLDKMNNNAYDPVSKPGGHLVSNHSYGVVLGWYRNASNAWTWAGNTGISAKEDYRFGFYSSKSKGLDDLLFSKPYYTVVWAAGNDRSDSGDGSRDPDGPDDTIGPEGVAKNLITVGAVSNVANYTQPSDVKMSDFSNWGPTDDGRIKPDLVGMGVNVFSSSVTNNGSTDAYATLSGTSMAAPNVTGSLLLLQQLYNQRNSNKYMWSSTVKALAIHTAKEAGPAPGPDYMYGWGLLDAKAAAEMILNEDGGGRLIRELTLGQGETYEYEIISDGITPIRATIAWTDPSGTPVGASLNPTTLMLVNDLDVRIIDEDGVAHFPWTLDPALGAGARAVQNKDNFRDNVEQVLISSPKPKKYTLKVSHKRDLKSGAQPFSLVFSAGVEDGAEETLYWIGAASGNWGDGKNWSLTPNGSAAGKVPGARTRVVFDGNSGQNKTVVLADAARAFSVNAFGNQILTINLNSKHLLVSNGVRISNQMTELKNGRVVFDAGGANEMLVELGQSIFENVRLDFVGGKWRMISGDKLDVMNIEAAQVEVSIPQLEANEISVGPQAILDGDFTSIKFSRALNVTTNGKVKANLKAQFAGANGQFSNSSAVPFEVLEVNSGTLALNSDGIDNLSISGGKAQIRVPSMNAHTLQLGPGATLEFGVTGTFTVLNEIKSTATQASKALISAPSAAGTLAYDIYRKLCFDHINVTKVNKTGQGIINLGVGATVQDASGWLKQDCADVLFAKFEASYTCVGSAVTFENHSEGAVSTYLWDFGQGNTSSLENPLFSYSAPGNYLVKLTISNSQGSTVFQQSLTIGANSLPKPVIVVNGDQLTSQQPSAKYQWYLNGQMIPGATQRSYVANSDGSYQVAIFDDSCNSLSDPVVISAIPEPDLGRFGVYVGPVPSNQYVKIQMLSEYRGKVTLSLLDIAGRVYSTQVFGKNSDELVENIALPAQAGMYLLRIETGGLTLHKKLIKY